MLRCDCFKTCLDMFSAYIPLDTFFLYFRFTMLYMIFPKSNANQWNLVELTCSNFSLSIWRNNPSDLNLLVHTIQYVKIFSSEIYRFFIILLFFNFLQNGCRWPFWMSENHFFSISFLAISDRCTTLIFFEIFDKMATVGHFGCPKLTLDHISGYFRSIQILYYYITEQSVRWYYGFSIAAASARRPWRREHSNSTNIQPISFKFYMRVDTPLGYFAIEIRWLEQLRSQPNDTLIPQIFKMQYLHKY